MIPPPFLYLLLFQSLPQQCIILSVFLFPPPYFISLSPPSAFFSSYNSPVFPPSPPHFLNRSPATPKFSSCSYSSMLLFLYPFSPSACSASILLLILVLLNLFPHLHLHLPLPLFHPLLSSSSLLSLIPLLHHIQLFPFSNLLLLYSPLTLFPFYTASFSGFILSRIFAIQSSPSSHAFFYLSDPHISSSLLLLFDLLYLSFSFSAITSSSLPSSLILLFLLIFFLLLSLSHSAMCGR